MNGLQQSYLRTHRDHSGLCQHEVSLLIGLGSGQIVSRYETSKHVPKLDAAIACQVLFDEVAEALFPGLSREVEEDVAQRIRQLIEVLKEKKSTPRQLQKIEFLEKALGRIEESSKGI